MQGTTLILFASLTAFAVKHYLFDFLFQTSYHLKNKGTYGHPGGIMHAGLHALGSIPAVLVWSPAPWLLLALIGGEFAVHYHVDWLKERVVKRNGWTSHDFGFWQALGLDQLVHGLTYLAMAAIAMMLTVETLPPG